jgi:hypothetical protein
MVPNNLVVCVLPESSDTSLAMPKSDTLASKFSSRRTLLLLKSLPKQENTRILNIASLYGYI